MEPRGHPSSLMDPTLAFMDSKILCSRNSPCLHLEPPSAFPRNQKDRPSQEHQVGVSGLIKEAHSETGGHSSPVFVKDSETELGNGRFTLRL
jgi:hypothetical protein